VTRAKATVHALLKAFLTAQPDVVIRRAFRSVIHTVRASTHRSMAPFAVLMRRRGATTVFGAVHRAIVDVVVAAGGDARRSHAALGEAYDRHEVSAAPSAVDRSVRTFLGGVRHSLPFSSFRELVSLVTVRDDSVDFKDLLVRCIAAFVPHFACASHGRQLITYASRTVHGKHPHGGRFTTQSMRRCEGCGAIGRNSSAYRASPSCNIPTLLLMAHGLVFLARRQNEFVFPSETASNRDALAHLSEYRSHSRPPSGASEPSNVIWTASAMPIPSDLVDRVRPLVDERDRLAAPTATRPFSPNERPLATSPPTSRTHRVRGAASSSRRTTTRRRGATRRSGATKTNRSTGRVPARTRRRSGARARPGQLAP